MSPTKRFLLVVGAVYVVLALTIIWLWGPPGLSRAYLDQYEADHERYLKIIKTEAYKLYLENPRLHPLDEALRGAVAFVEEYEGRPQFREEQRRRRIFSYVFEFLNAGVVVLIAVRFGWKPLLGFLDQEIAKVRTAIERAQEAHTTAARQKTEAQEKLDRLDKDKRRIAKQAEELIHQEQAAVKEATAQSLAQIARETEDRKRREELGAAMLIKHELVTQSIGLLTERSRAEASPEMHEEWIGRFIRGLEKAR